MSLVKQKGVTLLELMIGLTIAGIFLTLAIPSFQSMIEDGRRESSAVSMVNALALARSESVARGMAIAVRPNVAGDNPPGTGAYSGGVWSVVTNDGSPAYPGDPSPVIEVYQNAPLDSVEFGGDPNFSSPFVFDEEGTLDQTAVLTFCFDNAASCSQVRVNLVGRAQVARIDHP